MMPQGLLQACAGQLGLRRHGRAGARVNVRYYFCATLVFFGAALSIEGLVLQSIGGEKVVDIYGVLSCREVEGVDQSTPPG